MNCLLLLVLLFCCGNNGCENNCSGRNRCGNDNGNNGCGCINPRDNVRNDDCGCRTDGRPEPRLEPRPFVSFQGGSTCGCEGSKDN